MASTSNRRPPQHVAAAIIAALIALLALLPIANWIPGGRDAPWYALIASEWLSGSAIVVGVGIVFAILSRKIDALWHPGAMDELIARWAARPVRAWLILGALAFGLYCIIALTVFSGRPLSIDELVQVLHAQILATGHLSRPTFAYPEFFSTLHIIDMHGRYFSQFPVGGPAMLAIGVLLGAPWIIGPLFGAIAVIAYAAYVRVVEPKAGVTLGATLLFAFAPFIVFMSGSQMNDVTTLAWVMIGVAGLARVMSSDVPRPWAALVCGLGFGIAATIRPVDALAFAAPAGIWYLVRALRDRTRWRDAIPALIGVGIPVLVLLWVNAQTTGAALLFGYEQLWGKSHSLGFHKSPWGAPHTPARGLELINLYFLRLQTYLFESPLPSLVPAIGALALARRLDRFDRYLLASSGLLVGFYFAYWFDGFYLGPRFMYLLVPAAALWTARFLPLLKDRFGTGLPYRMGVYGYLTAGLVALFVLIPSRATQYANGLVTMRWDADSAAAAGSIRNALVLVRESWGAQLVARLWALGVSRSEADLLYGHVDACALDTRITALEHGSTRGEAAFDALRPLLRDSARTVGSPFSPDTTEQYLPGTAYSPRCVARINDDRVGTTLLAPLLLEHGGGNIYARDLHGRDSLLARAYPGRPIYVVRPANSDVGTPPQFYRAPDDSLWAAWRSGDSLSMLLAVNGVREQQQRDAAERAASDSVTRVLDELLGPKTAPSDGTRAPEDSTTSATTPAMRHTTSPSAPHR